MNHFSLTAIFCASLTLATQSHAQDVTCGPVAECAQKAVEAAEAARQVMMALVPPGAVMAFNLDTCPAGWDDYAPAQGRFIRGISPSGHVDPDKVRKPGSVQADAFQGHWHTMDNVDGAGLKDSAHGEGASRRRALTDYGNIGGNRILGPIKGGHGDPRIATETRPVNVALLFCERGGV